MAKQRKTREQKIATSIKHQQGQFHYSLQHISPTVTKEHIQVQPITTYTYTTYAYVVKDLRKTFFVCISFLAAELLLLFLLQHRMVVIPGVVY